MALIKERTKKRKGENVIGKIIYGFLLFAPLMVIAFTSLYAVFNKNAFESYSGTKEDPLEYEHITPSANMFAIGQKYIYANEAVPGDATRNRLDIIPVGNTIKQNNTTIENVSRIVWYKEGSTTNYFYYTDTTSHYTNLNNTTVYVEFTIASFTFENDNFATPILNYFYKVVYNEYTYLDNSFEYGCYKAENSNLFNWAKNTGTYQVLEATTTQLDIRNTFVPFLMTYWLLISVIYFIFDIALILIWAVHDKIHELKDSI